MELRRPSVDSASIAKHDFHMLLRVGVAVSVLGLILGGVQTMRRDLGGFYTSG